MGYVALSRVRTLLGLSLKGLNDTALKVHPEVLEYDRQFRIDSAEDSEKFRAKSPAQVLKIQKEFLERIVPKGGKAKKVKTDTVEETKKMVLAEIPLKEIAETRKLKIETIISHLEKLREIAPSLDMKYIKKEISTARMKKIAAAFTKAAAKGNILAPGVLPPLSPVKSILGSSFSFEEIRIARLFL
jgi:hypothetical protein